MTSQTYTSNPLKTALAVTLFSALLINTAHAAPFSGSFTGKFTLPGNTNPTFTTVYRKTQSDFYPDYNDTQFTRINYSYRLTNASLSKSTYDASNDGTIEETYFYNDASKPVRKIKSNETSTYSYDAEGRIASLMIDHDLDSEDLTRYWSYDSAGNKSKIETDKGNDGSINQELRFSFDSQRNNTNLTSIREGVVAFSHSTAYAYTLNSQGKVIYEVVDFGADGTDDSAKTFTYDARGNRLSRLYDASIDGSYESEWYFTYDNANRLLSESYDNDADGTPDRTIRNIYNSYGKISKTYTDWDGDGINEAFHIYRYDSNRNLVKEYIRYYLGGPILLNKHTWTAFRILSF